MLSGCATTVKSTDQTTGISYQETIAKLGEPNLKIETPGGMTCIYNACVVHFENGILISIDTTNPNESPGSSEGR